MLLACTNNTEDPVEDTPLRYAVTFDAGEGGSVNRTGGEYNVNTSITVVATPNTGYNFESWSDGSADNPRTIIVTENMQLIANFTEIDDLATEEENTGEENTGGLTLIWADEFDYSGRPDESKWFHQTFAPNNGSWWNNELQHYIDDENTTFVNNGTLKIVAQNQSFTTQETTKEYTSARLNSKFDFKYGRVDVRAKLPQGGGTWPAIWTLGTNINEQGNYYGDRDGSVGWPACGEIDIMEQNGWDKTQSYGYFHWGDISTSEYRNFGEISFIADSATFHLYSLIWDEQKMQILLDDTVFVELPNDANNPYDNPHYLLLNIAIGGNLGGEVPTDFGSQIMEIDYVRVYQ